MLVISMNAGAWLFSRPLEARYSENPMPVDSADAIVVLAGYVHKPMPNTPYAYAGTDTYLRLQRTVWLFKNWRRLPILACGGGEDSHWYAETMRNSLESQGIPPELIWIESRSRSTHENAVFGGNVLREHHVSRIVLVVEANFMPRAAASFRKQGFTVVPLPSGYTDFNRELSDWIPNWRAIAANADILHEAIGLIWYRLRGWI